MYSLERKFKFKDLCNRKRLFWNDPKKILLFPLVKKIYPYTMQNYGSLSQLHDLIKDLDDRKVEGSIVEMGCWNGGCGAFMAKISNRKVWLFDSFEGLPELSEEDRIQAENKNLKIKEKGDNTIRAVGFIKTDEKNVVDISRQLGVEDRIKIVKGWFQDTLPKYKEEIGKIALLRLDGDIYESTKVCFEELYDQVADTGYVVIDDYRNWDGCRRAMYEFFYKRNINPCIELYPFGGKAHFKKRS